MTDQNKTSAEPSAPALSVVAGSALPYRPGEIVYGKIDHERLPKSYSTKMTMILTKEQQQQMLEAAKPLIKWMNENCHPHCTAHVDQNTIELTEGIASNCTDEFLRD